MSGVGESLAISVALGVAKRLLQEVMKEVVSPLWERNKIARTLHARLSGLEPIISDIDVASSSGPQPRSTEAWVEELGRRLEGVKKVLVDNNRKSGYLAKLWTSKKLSEETAFLNGVCGEAALVGLLSSLKIHDKVSTIEESLREMNDKIVMSTSSPSSSSSASVGGIKEALVAKLKRQDTLAVFGGDRVFEDARKMLLEDGTRWCGLWAAGGAGKTHAAQRVFNDSQVQAHFRGGCYWLTVGQSKTTRNVLCDLRQSMVGQSSPPGTSCMSDMDLKNLVLSELQEREKVLVVLDDVWKQELSMLDVMRGCAGCKVLVTTRIQEVLDKQHATKLEVALLSFEDSWRLFCRHAWQDVSQVPRELEGIAKDITGECKGLPLALKVIGGGCAGKTDVREWTLAYERLKNADHCDLTVKLFLQLKASVDELEHVPCAHLKDCFLYFAAFPEDYKVDVERNLIPLWLGEGIIGKEYDPMSEAWEKLRILTSRSLVEMHGVGNSDVEQDVRFKVHDVLRDLARYLLQNDICVAKRDCLYIAGEDLPHFPKEWVPNCDGGDVSLYVRRLSVMNSKVEVLPRKLLHAPKLQVMILEGNPIKAIPDGFFHQNLVNLKVLNLSGTDITSLPSNVGNLKHLVVLNLEACSKLTKLPSSLGQLTNLEVLNLGWCVKLAYLPRSLFSLRKLQHLIATGLLGFTDVWKKVGGTLQVVNRRGTLKDLNHLVALKQLRITSDSQKSLPSGIFKALKELQVLDLEFSELVAIPETTADELQHLEELSLLCESLTSLPCSFGLFLTNLHTLSFWSCEALRSLPDSFCKQGAFPVLKKLAMWQCSSMVSFPELDPGAMPQLEGLVVAEWYQLVDFPKVIGKLTTLRFLELSHCSNLRSLEHDGVGVQSLTNLEELLLRYSGKIFELPVSLAQLPKLRKIDMWGCSAVVPAEVEDMAKIGKIEMRLWKEWLNCFACNE